MTYRRTKILALTRYAAVLLVACAACTSRDSASTKADARPADPEAQRLATQQMLSQGRWEDVIERANAALQKNPDDAEALVFWGNATAHLFTSTWSLTRLPASMRTINDFEGARLNLRPGTTGAEDDRAETAFRKALSQSPALLDAQLALVNLYWARGHPEQGEELLRQVAEANPRHAAANYALGAFYVFSDRGAEAEPFLKHAADAGERGARFALVDYYTSVHRDSDALKVLESMPATYDESGDVSIRAATLDSRQGRYEETLRRLDRLLARDPAHLRARLLKAGVLLRTHKVDVALALAQSTVAAEPESAEARSVLGKALRASAQPVEAIDQFNEALRLDPGDAAAASGLAALYADRKTNLQAALGLALTAKRQLPDDPEVNDVLGWVYVRLNRAALGLEELEAAVSADPNNPVYRFHLGMAYVALARPREAREELTRAVALDGTFAEAADARRALASLTP